MMFYKQLILVAFAATFSTQAVAGTPMPMPGAGLVGPAALVAAIGAAMGIKFLRSRRK